MDPLERAVAKALAEKEQAQSKPKNDEMPSIGASRSTPGSRQQSINEADRRAIDTTASAPSSMEQDSQPTVNLSALETAGRVNLEDISREPLTRYEADEESMRRAKLVGHLDTGKAANIYSMLRTQVLQKMQRNHCRSLGIVGAHTGAGKSSVATNLALSIARTKDRAVVLVDLDLRAPSLQRFFGIESKYHLADYLDGHYRIEEVCITTQFPGLHLCLSADYASSAGELLDGERAKTLSQDLSKIAPDPIVIFDLPPILGVPDVHTFLPNFDAALIVVEYARTTKPELEETLRLLEQKPLVGYVVNNGQLSSDTSYGYGYGYGDSTESDS